MAHRIVTNLINIMAKKKKEEEGLQEYVVPEIHEKKKLTPLSVDFGREDLNNIGTKINEIIDHLNG